MSKMLAQKVTGRTKRTPKSPTSVNAQPIKRTTSTPGKQRHQHVEAEGRYRFFRSSAESQCDMPKQRFGSEVEEELFPKGGVASSLEEYYISGGKLKPPPLEDFTGPVKICAIGKGRGRGLVVTADVVAGQLLVVSNPLAKACKVETEVAVEGNYRTGESGRWTGSHVLADELVATLVARAWKSSREREMLCTLCSGDDEELPVPPMELFQPRVSASLEPAMQDFAHRGPGMAKDNNVDPQETMHTPFTKSEVVRICGVVQCNAFGHTNITHKNNIKLEVTRSWSCGLWMIPSFMNHSCTPSVSTLVIGKAMLVVAARDLKPGNELTVAYFDIFRPLKERRISMRRSWNFVCTCSRCTLEGHMQDSLHLVAEAYGLREARAAINMQLYGGCPERTWDRALSVMDLAQLVEYMEKVVHSEPGLSPCKRNWIRASFLSAYLADGESLVVDVKGLEEPRHTKAVRKTHIQAALSAAASVSPGHPQTLQIAAVLQERAFLSYGKHSFISQKATKQALNSCMRLVGHQSPETLQRIVTAAAKDVLASRFAIFLSRP